jgi:hypothetical protein
MRIGNREIFVRFSKNLEKLQQNCRSEAKEYTFFVHLEFSAEANKSCLEHRPEIYKCNKNLLLFNWVERN